MTTPDHLSITEAASRIGVTSDTLRRWADAGEIACIRTIGGHRRFTTEAVDALRARLASGPHSTEAAS